MTGSEAVRASVVVEAPPDRVWKTLLAFEEYEAWNPLITRIRGQVVVGQRLQVRVSQPGVPPVTITPLVTGVDPERELRWVSDVPTAAVLTARHRFQVTPIGNGVRTRFVQTETFTGAFGRLVPGAVRRRLHEGFAGMNAALKRRVEAGD